MFGKLNENPLYADRSNGIEFGLPTKAKTEWLETVGITSSSCRKTLTSIFISSPFFDQLNDLDKRKVRSTGQHVVEGLDESGEYWLLHIPNGVVRIERDYGHRPVWFQNEDYTVTIAKPVEPPSCNDQSCNKGWIYNMGTSYPCSKCTAYSDYRTALKVWENQKAS